MSRKLWSATLGLAVLLAACGSQKPSGEAVRVSFVPQTVDFLDDVGYSPSLALDGEGNPHLSYLGFTHIQTKQEKKNGVIPAARSVTAPRLPAVLVADQTKGLWNRGAAVQSSDQATGPKVPIDRSDQTATAVDQNGVQHVVWTERDGLFYSNDEGGAFPDQATKVAGGAATGPSIAVEPSGEAWISFYDGNSVEAAAVAGSKVSVQKVASVGGCGSCPSPRTAIQAGRAGPVIAFVDPGAKTAMLAIQSGKSWSAERIGSGAGGFGISMAVEGDGTPHVSYFDADGSVVAVTASPGGGQSAKVGSVPTSHPATDLSGGTAIAVSKDGTQFVAWADPTQGIRLAQAAGGRAFAAVKTQGTGDGTSPALAATADGRAILAWFQPPTEDLMLGTYPESEVGFLALPSPSATPAVPSVGPGGACAPGDIDITAPPGAGGTGFSTTKVSAPAKPFVICFDNKDSTQHNVAVFESEADATGGGKALFTGEVVQGPVQIEYKVNALQAGGYFFRCDVHPTTMTGTLTVK